MNKMQKITVSATVALALSLGLGVTAKSAWAEYLSAPDVVGTSSTAYTSSEIPARDFQVEVQGSSGTFYALISPTSTFGNTAFTGSAVPTGTTSIQNGDGLGALPNNAFYYSATGLNLTQLTSENSSFDVTSNNGTIAGNVLSQVYAVGANPTVAGAHQGELVFTYQISLTQAPSAGLSDLSVALFNNPNNTVYTVGDGFLGSASAGYTPIGQSLSGTMISNVNNAGGEIFYASNGSVNTLEDNLASTNLLYAGDTTPQIFVATNGYSYQQGDMTLGGTGVSFFEPAFVPGSPEPSTLVLLGTGLGLLAFGAFRKKANSLNI